MQSVTGSVTVTLEEQAITNSFLFQPLPYNNELKKISTTFANWNDSQSTRIRKWGRNTTNYVETYGFQHTAEMFSHLIKRINKLKTKIITESLLKKVPFQGSSTQFIYIKSPATQPMRDGEYMWSEENLNRYITAFKAECHGIPLQNPFDGAIMNPQPHSYARQMLRLVNTVELEIKELINRTEDISSTESEATLDVETISTSIRPTSHSGAIYRVYEETENSSDTSIVDYYINLAQESLSLPLRNTIRFNTAELIQTTEELAISRENTERENPNDVARLESAVALQHELFVDSMQNLRELSEQKDAVYRATLADLNNLAKEEKLKRIKLEERCQNQDARIHSLEFSYAKLSNQPPPKKARCLIS